MLKPIYKFALTIAALTAVDAHANSDVGYSVYVDSNGYGNQTFKCQGRTFYSDIPLPNLHGCDVEVTEQGAHGLPSKIITVHYDWEPSENGGKKPRKETFYQNPDGEVYRLLDISFLHSDLLNQYFKEMVTPLPESVGGVSNITLERFGRRNIEVYNNNFCMNYHLNYPFQGIMGWCQGDRLVGGDIDYLGGAMTFSEAAIRVQNFIYDKGLKIRGRVLSDESVTAFNKDQKDWVYYGFAVPAQKSDGEEGAYIFRVYFNGYIEIREVSEMPEDPYDL